MPLFVIWHCCTYPTLNVEAICRLTHQSNYNSNPTVITIIMPSPKKRKETTAPNRQSRRQIIRKLNKQAQKDPIENGVLYMDKARDGLEEKRNESSLQSILGRNGPMAFEALPKGNELNAVNHRRRFSQQGKDPCYDVMDRHGSSIYAYSLPLTLMTGLLQTLKSDESVSIFKKEANTLSTHEGTNYMFLHWLGTGEERSDGNDYKEHDFCKSRPGLVIIIESIGNMILRKILFNSNLVAKFPGILSNKRIMTSTDQDYQDPHWDFVGWRFIKAVEMPWVLHIPLCKEGMMLHVWPTHRDVATHANEKEQLQMGTPKLVFVAFGDYLLLRADVCHGGCFGSRGNMRFHMVLRRKNCPLVTTKLEMLDKSGIDVVEYKKKKEELSKLLGRRHTYFQLKQSKKAKTVTAYIRQLENVYPEHDTWTNGLLDNLNYD